MLAVFFWWELNQLICDNVLTLSKVQQERAAGGPWRSGCCWSSWTLLVSGTTLLSWFSSCFLDPSGPLSHICAPALFKTLFFPGFGPCLTLHWASTPAAAGFPKAIWSTQDSQNWSPAPASLLSSRLQYLPRFAPSCSGHLKGSHFPGGWFFCGLVVFSTPLHTVAHPCGLFCSPSHVIPSATSPSSPQHPCLGPFLPPCLWPPHLLPDQSSCRDHLSTIPDAGVDVLKCQWVTWLLHVLQVYPPIIPSEPCRCCLPMGSAGDSVQPPWLLGCLGWSHGIWPHLAGAGFYFGVVGPPHHWRGKRAGCVRPGKWRFSSISGGMWSGAWSAGEVLGAELFPPRRWVSVPQNVTLIWKWGLYRGN